MSNKLQFHRLFTTKDLQWGDGGQTTLSMPVMVCDKLPVSKQVHNTLQTEFQTLADNNNDWRSNEPIQNVIDPELYAYRVDRNIYIDSVEHILGGMVQYNYRDQKIENPKFNKKDGRFLRGTYQWISTIFEETNRFKHGKSSIKIKSPIHNLGPRNSSPSNENMYKCIENIFELMLPMFNDCSSTFETRTSNQFKVIVKSQRYAIKPGTGYAGHWHSEGLTERILMAGIYYYEWDDGLTGGNIKFRCPTMPDRDQMGMNFYFDHNDYDDEGDDVHNIQPKQLKQHSAIVFDNRRLVHRVRLLKNTIKKDNKTRYRGFLAFFIVDPDNQHLTMDTKRIPSLKREFYSKLIRQSININATKTDSDSKEADSNCGYKDFIDFNCYISSIIAEYAGLGMTLIEAKKFRSEAIKLKQETKGKWGYCHFGNCGYEKFFGLGKTQPWIIQCDALGHNHLPVNPMDMKNSDVCAYSQITSKIGGYQYSWMDSTHSEMSTQESKIKQSDDDNDHDDHDSNDDDNSAGSVTIDID